MQIITTLADMSFETFLSEYWQKQPLLIRKAFKDFSNPLSANELAGLACEADVESRIVLEKDGNTPWECRHGPFLEQDFMDLPASHWTLLVQDVEKHIPGLTALTDQFDFIPHWRLDDLMISYAPDQGSVGAHVDAYDVFLLQAEGKRQWQISSEHIDINNQLENTDLKILRTFKPDQQWLLEPGDMLYLPPGIAHHGIAMGECMTYSIGFRAPSHLDVLQSHMETIIKNQNCDILYTDPGLSAQANPHEITPATVEKFSRILEQHLDQAKNTVQQSIGTLLSESKMQFQASKPEDSLSEQGFLSRWQQTQYLYRNTAIKFLYIARSSSMDFYIDGQTIPCRIADTEIAEWICSTQEVSYKEITNTTVKESLLPVLYLFYQHGFYYFGDD